MSLRQIATLVLAFHLVLVKSQDLNETLEDCGHSLRSATGYGKLFKVLRSLVHRPDVDMKFYLYKKEFPTCGREIRIDDDSLQNSGFNASHQTRIIIHGWMSQSKSPFNRDVKDAYLSLDDFNVIVVDWSVVSTTLNYYKVVKLIENFGEIVANFTKHLHNTVGADYDDMYLIGHSLGAQIAGSAGKQIHPEQFNTIFALDPAGPAFREIGLDHRIDPTDAKYVESIQTSVNLGLLQPVGNATFFPNKGVYQNCLGFGCSHRRAHQFFAESITSNRGFWGTLCNNEERKCPKNGMQYKMGGEPSQPKNGTFYLKTRGSPPYALGKTHKYLYA